MIDHTLANEDASEHFSSASSSASSVQSIVKVANESTHRPSIQPGNLLSTLRSDTWKSSRGVIQREHTLKLRRRDGNKIFNFQPSLSNSRQSISAFQSHQFNGGDDGADPRHIHHVPKQFKIEQEATDYSATLRDFLKTSSYEVNYIKSLHNLSISAITAISLFGYLFLVSLFAVLAYLIDHDKTCLCIGEECDENIGFRAYYDLSWHTFSTVGFGNIHPQPEVSSSSCAVVALPFLLESFAGVLYAGLCGALLYSRISKDLDHADVLFSNGICISYCRFEDLPVLELRIVNCRANTVGGEIIDASVDCLVGLKGWASVSTKEPNGSISRNSDLISLQSQSGCERMSNRIWSINHMQAHSNPECVTITQPLCCYFSRIWSVKHILDKNSSLLLPEVKRRMKENGGKWPEDMLSKEKVVESLVPFKEIIVTIKGTSVETGRGVFSCKTYGLANIFSGYRFADMLCEDSSDGKIKVDFKLLSDVIEESEYFDDANLNEGSNIHLDIGSS